jgi:hypothetical protein
MEKAWFPPEQSESAGAQLIVWKWALDLMHRLL